MLQPYPGQITIASVIRVEQSVNPSPLTIRTGGLLFSICAMILCSSCGTDARTGLKGRLPDPALARQALESSLGVWHLSPELATTSSPSPSVVFVDQQRRPGQTLREFKILGESEAEGCRRFQVKLSLAEPEETRLVAYYVFGEDPIWVYRSEDFDMIMHWECPPDNSPVTADPSHSEDPSRTKPEHHDRDPGTAVTAESKG